MRYLSLDASSTCIGYSFWEDSSLICYGKLKPDKSCDGWRERLVDLIPQLHKLMKEHLPKKTYVEDVPLMGKGGKATLVTLGAVQGAIIGVCAAHKVEVEFISVATWRKNIGLHDGTKEGMKRDSLKRQSIEKANELFALSLQYVSDSSKKNDDDISDSILIFASTRDEYQKKSFGRKSKIK